MNESSVSPACGKNAYSLKARLLGRESTLMNQSLGTSTLEKIASERF